MIEPRIQYVASADGTQIAYTTIGEGPPVVVAPNVFGDIDSITSVRPTRLPQALHKGGLGVVLLDGRGAGASDRNVSDMSLAARLADLEAVVDKLGLQQLRMAGVIHGCAAAVAYAAKHPHRVSRLALAGPYSRGVDYYAATAPLRAIRSLIDMAEEHWEFFTLSLANWMLNFEDPARAKETAALYRSAMNPRDYLSFISACDATDITDLLPQVKAPTLVVRDASSVFTTVPEFTRRVAAAIPSAQAVTVDSPASMASAILGFFKGEQPSASRHPSVRSVVTVLFTDIVGHTAMMRRLGDEKGREVLREHERITREVLKAHNGAEIKTMGDGFMASFASVTKAVECAVALQRAMEQEADGKEPIQVRCGLNAGEPIEDEGPDGRSDLFGSSVILASRIAARANGGEILASMAVRELCSGKGFLFADLGDHELRGFEDPVRVFEVKWKD